MLNGLNARVKEWTRESCVADLMRECLSRVWDFYANYFNNHDSIMKTIDQSAISNAKFAGFLIKIDRSKLTNMMK